MTDGDVAMLVFLLLYPLSWALLGDNGMWALVMGFLFLAVKENYEVD